MQRALESDEIASSENEENAEHSAESDPTGGGSSLLIIPNGAGAAEKLERVRKAVRPKATAARRDSSNPAELLLSGPYREMHAPQVLEGVKLLSDGDPKRRIEGANQLGLAGPEARTVLPLLRQLAKKEKDKLVRVRLAEAIVKIVPDEAEAIGVLTEMLGDPNDWKVRQAAAAGLTAATKGNNTDAVSKLTGALNDSHPRVRAMVALTLGAFGPKAKEALPRLKFATTTDIPRVQEAAQAAIACIAPETASEATAGDAAQTNLDSKQEPAFLPAGETGTGPQNKSAVTLEKDDDPFEGTLFDFDTPAVGTVK